MYVTLISMLASIHRIPNSVMLDLVEILRSVCQLAIDAPCSSVHSPCFPSVGSEPIDALARRIWVSVGPSGPNKVCTSSENPDTEALNEVDRNICTVWRMQSAHYRRTRMIHICTH